LSARQRRATIAVVGGVVTTAAATAALAIALLAVSLALTARRP
jgi:hypothetical protein